MKKAWDIFQKNVSFVIVGGDIIEKVFKDKHISHIELAKILKEDLTDFVLNYIDEELWDKLPKSDDGGLSLDLLQVHDILKLGTPGYYEFDQLAQHGFVLYKDMEINKTLGYPVPQRMKPQN